jgi:ligand-binding sensor domain-containing protein/signal transduction histidine kinase
LKSPYLSILIIQSLLLISLSGVSAQPIRLQFKKLTIDDGLSSSIVSTIIQDQKGFIWVGTPDGLNRYDGFKFVVYRNNPVDSSSIADNVIQTIFEDHNKDLFLGTEKGLCLYNREKDCFINFMFDKYSPLKGIDCGIKKIVEDSKGNLWLAANVGLIYFDRIKNQITRYIHNPDNPESLSNNNVESVLIDNLNRIWVTTRKGLNIFIPENGSFMHCTMSENSADNLSNTVFLDMIEDKEGNIWFGSNEGLYCQKLNQAAQIIKLIHYQYDIRDKSSLSINQVTSLFVDDSGNLWIGTENGGMNLFDKKNQRFWHYRIDDYDPQSLNNESIETIYQDKAGNLWVGTYTGGLNIAIKNSGAILKYQNLPGAPLSLSHNSVASFMEDHENQIWVGTDGGGLNLFDEAIGRFKRFNIDNSHLGSNSILSIMEDSENQIWLGTWAGGLIRYDNKTGSFTSFTTKNSGIQDDNIYTIEEGYNGDLWLGSFEHGLINFLSKERKFIDYTTGNSELGNEMINKIVKFPRGRLLIGTTRNFQIFSPADSHFISYNYDPNNNNSLSYPRVTDILVENDTCIWIGTPNGLNRFNPVTESFTRYYEKDGLPNSFIKGIVIDKSGRLWVTTNGGICRFDYKKSAYKNFTKADGLQSNEFTERSIFKTKNGALLLGGTKGFNLVYPEKITENKVIPEIQITDLKVLKKSVKPGTKNSLLDKNITETKSLTLSHDLVDITFSFAVMDFSAPEKNKYAYVMENLDKNWIYPENKGEAVYTNLNPGKYVFHVKGSNNDGLWNETGSSISITILPAWWNTWWFRMVVIFSLILLLAVIFLFRVRQLKNQKILLERSVELKTNELQTKNAALEERQHHIEYLNASKDKFFSIIAHDLKNPFNAIIGFSEILQDEIKSGDTAKMENYTGLINSSAVQTYRLLENLLEWANSQRGKMPFNPVALNLNQLFSEEILVLNEIANSKSITLKSSIPDNLTIIADKNMIKTILRNLISNAIKFTYKNGIVITTASVSDKNVEISVCDNGIGMTKETTAMLFRLDANLSTSGTENEKGTGLGLLLCKEFVEKHGGKIWAESIPGNGSTFKFILPFNNNSSIAF